MHLLVLCKKVFHIFWSKKLGFLTWSNASLSLLPVLLPIPSPPPPPPPPPPPMLGTLKRSPEDIFGQSRQRAEMCRSNVTTTLGLSHVCNLVTRALHSLMTNCRWRRSFWTAKTDIFSVYSRPHFYNPTCVQDGEMAFCNGRLERVIMRLFRCVQTHKVCGSRLALLFCTTVAWLRCPEDTIRSLSKREKERCLWDYSGLWWWESPWDVKRGVEEGKAVWKEEGRKEFGREGKRVELLGSLAPFGIICGREWLWTLKEEWITKSSLIRRDLINLEKGANTDWR